MRAMGHQKSRLNLAGLVFLPRNGSCASALLDWAWASQQGIYRERERDLSERRGGLTSMAGAWERMTWAVVKWLNTHICSPCPGLKTVSSGRRIRGARRLELLGLASRGTTRAAARRELADENAMVRRGWRIDVGFRLLFACQLVP